MEFSLSLKNVKLHEAENNWRACRKQRENLNNEQAKTEELHKKVCGILDKLTPQTMYTLVNQVQLLSIDNSDQLLLVVELFYEKAVNEPVFSVLCAQLCKILATVQVRVGEDDTHEYLNFRKLLVNRCQFEFEKDYEVELHRHAKLKEIEETIDPEKKKELQMLLIEEEQKQRLKSVGNISFIGELFNRGMLATRTMHICIRKLLLHETDESLECLCILLNTIGEVLEMKDQDLSLYFQTIKGILKKRKELSSYVRFMLQDLIELRQNRWQLNYNNSNPEKMEQIQKAERESMDSQFTLNSALCASRYQDDQTPQTQKNLNRQSRSSSSSKNSVLGGDDKPSLQTPTNLSQPPSTSASTEDTSTVPGNHGTKNPITIAPLGQQEFISQTHTVLHEFFYNNNNLKKSELMVAETFAQENLCDFVRESLNSSLEKSLSILQNAGTLLGDLVTCGVIPLSQYLNGLTGYLNDSNNLERGTSKVLLYTAEMLVPMLSSEAVPFCKLPDIAPPSQNGQMICEILHLLNKIHGPVWIREKWDAAGLKWSDFLPEDRIDSFIKENKLEFTVNGALPTSSTEEINWNNVQKKLCRILSPNQKCSEKFDMICDWIGANVGTHIKEPKFIRALTTAVCQSSINAENKLNENHFARQQRLIVKYVDNQEQLELQCLYAIQALMNQLQHPLGLLCQIFQSLWDNSTISSESFIAWENSTDPAEQAGKGVALKSLTSFYTTLCQLVEEDSNCEES